jgi:hypothetical protein
MRCPTCGDEYRDESVRLCADCGVALVPAGTAPGLGAPMRARLGRFHPALVDPIRARTAADLEHFETTLHDDGVDVHIGAGAEDRLRAELAVDWEQLLAQLDPEDRAEVMAGGGRLPGWLDPPDGIWVDREGQLRADTSRLDPGHGARAAGPALIAGGGLLLLAAWYVGEGGLGTLVATVIGLAIVLVGIFTPR